LFWVHSSSVGLLYEGGCYGLEKHPAGWIMQPFFASGNLFVGVHPLSWFVCGNSPVNLISSSIYIDRPFKLSTLPPHTHSISRHSEHLFSFKWEIAPNENVNNFIFQRENNASICWTVSNALAQSANSAE
jgi:hypothetical protein